MIRIMIVDDQELIRAGLRSILSAYPALEVVAEAADGVEALHRVAEIDIDVVLLDLRMPVLDGVETTRRLRERHPAGELGIVVLTTFDEDENVLAALRAGADGFFSKGAAPTELSEGILRVARGERALSSSAVNAVVDHVSELPSSTVDAAALARLAALTPREREVVVLIVDGLDNQEIAARLVVSPFTVKTHANRAMMKTGARDRAQLVSFAVQAGIRP